MEKGNKKTDHNFLMNYGFAILLIIIGLFTILTYKYPGMYCYEVIIYNENNGNQYVLPAEVHYAGKNGNPEYGLSKVYWGNGGYTLFGLEEIIPNETVTLLSEDGRKYNVRLTLTRSRHSDIIEKEDNSRIYELRFVLALIAVGVIMIIVKIISTRKSKT